MKTLLALLLLPSLAMAQVYPSPTYQNVTVRGALGVAGATTFSAAGTGLAVTNDTTIGGALGVTGAATLNGVFPITNPGTGNDATANINAAIALAVAAGGGTVLSPCGVLTVNGAVAPPYTGTTNPVQVPIRITGCNASPDSYLGNSTHGASVPVGGSRWDMRYTGADTLHPAKIDTRGAGLLEIDHLTLMDGGTDNFLFLQTTNTSLNIHDVRFSGNPACLKTTCAQNAIQLGGITSASSTLGTNVATDGFQGYGTQLRNLWFDHIKVAVGFGGSANGVHVENLTVDASCGSSDAQGAPYVFYGIGLGSGGNTFSGGIIEMSGYPYGIAMIGAGQNILNNFFGIGLYDEVLGSPSVGAVYYSATSINNTITSNQIDGALQPANVPSPGSPFNGFKTDNGTTMTPYTSVHGPGSGQAGLIISGGSSGTGAGPVLKLEYAGTMRGAFGAYSAIHGGAYTARETLSGYDGLILETGNVPRNTLDTNGDFYDNTIAAPIVPSSGDSVVLAVGVMRTFINPAATLAALTVTLPICNTSNNGLMKKFSFTNIVTALTVNSLSGTVKASPSSAAVGGEYGFVCYGATTTWYPTL